VHLETDETASPAVPSGTSFQSLAAQLSRILGAADTSTLDVALDTCLEKLGCFADVDVAFATLVDDNDCVSDDWHWIRPGRVAHAPSIGTPIAATFGSATEFLRLGHTVAVDDLMEIELAPSERALATANGLRAIVMAPVLVGTQLLGLVGLQVCDESHCWGSAAPGQVELLAQLLVQAVTRTRQRGALAAANVRARRIAEYIPDGLLLLDTEGVVSWVSPSFVRMSGVAADSIVGRPANTLFHPSDHTALHEHLAGVAIDHESVLSAQMLGSARDWRWADLAFRLASEPSSDVLDEIVMTVRDNHERHLRELQLVERSDLDSLTGLLNRAALDRAIAELAEGQPTVLIAFCDIDDFKSINDARGHVVGDDVLCALAGALRGVVRADDLIARMGGDEFVVVIPGVDNADEARVLGERLVRSARTLDIDVSLSVGVCGPGPAAQTKAMRRIADEAMYEAKRRGKNGWVHREWETFDGGM
jgi:diguanylate cyclase (GGDEF)-like protein/PAS domain S-box-containing protein